jgi:hypothetical protein
VVDLGWRILLAGLAMGAVLYPLSRFSIFLSAPAGFVVYVGAIYLLRAIDPEEWRLAQEGLISRFRPRNPGGKSTVGEGGKA